MPRTHRVFAAGVAYHVMSRGSGRTTIFRDPADYERYLELLLVAKRRFGIEIFHYVLMPNHVHLLLRASTGNGPNFMCWLNAAYARFYCKKRKKIGHVWKNRYKNIPIETDAYLLTCGNYIEMNPTRAKLVDNPKGWPYSSYRFYAEGAVNPMVDMNPMYLDFGATSKKRMEKYRNWIGKTRQ